MTEQIDIQKHITILQDRVKFLREWINHLTIQVDKYKAGKREEIGNMRLLYESRDKIYQLQIERNHKEFLITAREKDKEMFEKQRQAIVQKLNTEMGEKIKGLRTKIMPDVKTQKLADGIIKRFSKNQYPTINHKIQDFKMAEKLLK